MKWLWFWLDRFKVFGDGFTGLLVKLENRLNRFYGFRPYGLCWDNFLVMLCVYGFAHGFDMVLAVLNAGCMYVLVYVAV